MELIIKLTKLKNYNIFFRKICGFKPLTQQEVMVEFARRSNASMVAAQKQQQQQHHIPQQFDIQLLQQQLRPNSGSSGGVSNLRQLTGDRIPAGLFVNTTTSTNNPTETINTELSDDQHQFQQKAEEIFRQWIVIVGNPQAQRDPVAAASLIAKLVINYICYKQSLNIKNNVNNSTFRAFIRENTVYFFGKSEEGSG